MHASSLVFYALVAVSSVFAHPIHHARELRIVGRDQSATYIRRAEGASNGTVSGFDALITGNKQFKDKINAEDSGLLQKLADEGQAPPFMFIGCSDSRVSEGTVFNAKPGTLFTQRNIANQFQPGDANAQSVLSYAVAELGVNHVIVMGHYGCGGVAASIASPPANQIDAANGAVQSWIQPIREIFRTSSRTEIVELRNKLAGVANIEEPDIKEPGFRALVEENVKAGVARIATDSVISNHYAALAASGTSGLAQKRAEGGAIADVFIHGWVYDIENGEIRDLGVSVGPPGKAIPAAPFAAVVASAEQSTQGHSSSSTAATATKAAETKAAETTKATETKATETKAAETKAAETKTAEKAAETKAAISVVSSGSATTSATQAAESKAATSAASSSGVHVVGFTSGAAPS